MSPDKKIFLISINETDYLYDAFVNSLKNRFPTVEIQNDLKAIKNKSQDDKVLHYGDYEDMDVDILMNDKNYKFSSYIYRKSLIRKHYLLNTIQHYVCKNKHSILNKSYMETFRFELDYAEFLDDYLDEFYELRDEILKEERLWILKPSMSDKGQGIRIFKTMDELQAIFDEFDEEYDDDNDVEAVVESTKVITSQLRHFIVQEYLVNPLLLSAYNGRKFHIRTYVMCNGDIDVFVYQRMLALFSGVRYDKIDKELFDFKKLNLDEHLTNTCLQKEDNDGTNDEENSVVVEFSELVGVSDFDKQRILKQINDNVRELFKAAINVDRMNFQPLSNAFEFYGLDFLVDDNCNVKVLEVNAYPDFKQSGDDLKGLVYEFIDSSMRVVGKEFYHEQVFAEMEENKDNLVNVLSIK